MFKVYTEEEFADLYMEGNAPQNCMTFVKSWWVKLPSEMQQQLLQNQPVMLLAGENYKLANK